MSNDGRTTRSGRTVSAVTVTSNGRRENANGAAGASTSSSSNGKAMGRSAAAPRAEKKPEEMMAEKQAQLDATYDKHDTLVREIFHMENFRMMLDYDPRVAKQDNSPVFHDYKFKFNFDLQESAGAAPSSSRRTRRTATQHWEQIQGPPTSTSPTKTTSNRKGNVQSIYEIIAEAKSNKGKGKEAVPAESASAPVPEKRKDKFTLPESLSVAEKAKSISSISRAVTTKTLEKGKGREKEKEIEQTSPERRASTRHSARLGNGKVELPPPAQAEDPISISAVAMPSRRPTRSSVVPVQSEMLPPAFVPPKRSASEASPGPRKRRRFDPPSTPQPDSQPVSARVLPRRAAAHRPEPNPSTTTTIPPPPPAPVPAPPSLRRIKLLVTRPPATFTHPSQIPDPPKFGHSLDAFLSSYTTLDEKDVTEDELLETILTQAYLKERGHRLRKEGRFYEPPEGERPLPLDGPHEPERKPRDVWTMCVEGVPAAENRYWISLGRRVAKQVAAKVEVYWEAQAVKMDKKRAQEERRLRALAKATIRQVAGEWKKVVFHIREQERRKEEAEEVRRGHEHLDAILNQSGHILETQQGDLARGESRSGSMRESDIEDDDDDEEEEDDEGEAEDGQEENTESLIDGVIPGREHDAGKERSVSVGDDLQTSASMPSTVAARSTSPLFSQLEGEDQDQLDESVIEIVSSHHGPSSTRSPSFTGDVNWTGYMLGYTQQPSEDDDDAPETPLQTESGLIEVSQSPDNEDVIMEDHIPQMKEHPNLETYPLHPQSPTLSGGLEYRAPLESGNDDDLPLSVNPTDLLGDSSGQLSALSGASQEDPARSDRATKDTPPNGSESDGQLVAGTHVTDPEPEPEPELDGDDDEASVAAADDRIPAYLRPYAVAPVDWDPDAKIKPPLLLRGLLRPYQQSGLEWLASLHSNNLNGILADEMGLGKTIQTIALLAHLACDRGIWGPHLIIVPTSVLLNWDMEFKKFLPGFKVLSYHGSTKRRKELRQGWNDKYSFNVCITSYTLASRDSHIFKRRNWYYMILDEAHMIKNFKSQRWNLLLMFRSFRRLLLTGTPLQNNLTELWALLQFLMSGSNFANLKEFGEWFSNPLEKAIEMGNVMDDDNMQRVTKLHTVLRPYLLRRLKRDVEKELPSKYEHLVLCPLSKRQRFLYDEFMSRAHTQDALQSGVYQKIANILMQLRKVCNHPNLFEVRPIVTSFAMERSAITDFEIKELLLRREFLRDDDSEKVNLELLGLRFVDRQNTSLIAVSEARYLDATVHLPFISEIPGEPPPKDTRTIAGFRKYKAWQQRASVIARWAHAGYLNRLRLAASPIYSEEALSVVRTFYKPLVPLTDLDLRFSHMDTAVCAHAAIKSYTARAYDMASTVDRFAFATPAVVARDLPSIVFAGRESVLGGLPPEFDSVLHRAAVKLQIAFPDPSLLQYDCGKLQELTRLLREKKAGGHRVLIFTQMTRILDILEVFLNFHGWLYLRLDGATKIEDRQYITERFNADTRVFCFIASSRSGGVGINLTGADTVVFYDSDFNPQMDRQCEDRAHRIGQIRDVHIYRFVSQHTVEEALLRKANQKRSLDDIVIQKGEFDWRTLFGEETEAALTNAIGEFEDTEDALAAQIAAREEVVMEGADEADFGGGEAQPQPAQSEPPRTVEETVKQEEEGEGGTTVDYMLSFVLKDWEFFQDW